jgi:hypothetical protein
MTRAVLAATSLLVACEPLSPITPPDAGYDGGICGGSLCPPEQVTGQLIDPWDLASDDANLYWLEYGLETTGTDGQLMKQSKSVTCLDRDAGCAVDLNQDPLGIYLVDTLTVGQDTVCWTSGVETSRKVNCQSLTTHSQTTVASNQVWATAPRFAEGSLWWANEDPSGGVMRSSLSGPAVSFVGRPNPTSVIAVPGVVAWTESGVGTGSVLSRAMDGGALVAIAIQQQAPRSIIACGDSLVWVNYGAGTVMKGTTAAGSGVPIVSNQQHPFEVVCDADFVYWLNAGNSTNGADGSLWQARLDGSEALAMVQGIPIAVALTQDDTFIYYIAQGLVTRLEGAIWKMRKHP